MAISAADAAKIASNYYRNISGNYDDLSIEEIEKNEEGTAWLITLGIPERGYAINRPSAKDYKVFEIDSDTKDVLSMKIRVIK